MANKILIFENQARELGAPGQYFALKLIDGGAVYTMYLEALTQPPTQPAVASQITATGVPIIAPSGAGDVIGIGTTNALPLWTDGPNSVIGDSLLSQSGGNLILASGNIVLPAAGLITFPDNVRQVFNPGAAVAGLNVGAVAVDPSTPINGDLWYDSALNLLRARINGVSTSLGAALAGGSANQVQYNNAGALGGISGLITNGSTTLVQTSTSAAAFESGPNGSTNPVFRVVNSGAGSETGLAISGGAATGGVFLTPLSSGADEGTVLSVKGNPSYALIISAGSNLRIDPMLLGSRNVGAGNLAGLAMGNANYVGWSSGASWFSGAQDLAIGRTAAGVLEINNGAAGTIRGWLNWSGERRMAADLPNLTTAFANLTDLTISGIVTGRKYFGRLVIKCNNTTATEGIKFDFAGGSATISQFWAVASATAGGTTVLGTVISTSLAGVLDFTTITGETLIVIDFSFVASGSGTLIPRFAENSTAVGTATVELGSFCWMHDVP